MKRVSTIVVLGNDKIGSRAMALRGLDREGVEVYLDRSSSYRRVWKLIRRGSLRVGLVLKMALAEFLRPRATSVVVPKGEIRSNGDLISLIREKQPDRVLFFRAGLIVSKKAISCGVPLLNIHCAKVPEYGGLGSIERALVDGALEQCATLHQITETIDRGEVFETEPYQLVAGDRYYVNENRAYEVGVRLLERVIQGNVGCSPTSG